MHRAYFVLHKIKLRSTDLCLQTTRPNNTPKTQQRDVTVT